MGRCSIAPVAARSVSPPNPPRITLKNERFVPLHMIQERIASEEPTSAPVMMSASPAGGWTSTRSPNPLSHHRGSLMSAPVASISVLPSHGIPRSGAVGRHAYERRGRVLRHSARSSIAAHPKQTAFWTHAHDHRRKVASCAAPTLPGDAPTYERHRPEQTPLYALVEEHFPQFLERLDAEGVSLPHFVVEEFEAYLKCGRLEYGFLRVKCDACRHEKLVGFSGKRRGFCPSCGARRMAETAAHLVEHVLPEQPIRQWVLSFLSAILPYTNAAWETRSIFLNFLIRKLPAPKQEDLSKGILEAIDMDSYRVEKQAMQKFMLADEDAEIGPIPAEEGGGRPEPELDRLSNIIATFNDLFGDIAWQDRDRVRRLITEEIPSRVAVDTAVRNARENSDRENARIEHDRALVRVMTSAMKDDTELFKQFMDNDGFKRWMTDTVFALAYEQAKTAPSGTTIDS